MSQIQEVHLVSLRQTAPLSLSRRRYILFRGTPTARLPNEPNSRNPANTYHMPTGHGEFFVASLHSGFTYRILDPLARTVPNATGIRRSQHLHVSLPFCLMRVPETPDSRLFLLRRVFLIAALVLSLINVVVLESSVSVQAAEEDTYELDSCKYRVWDCAVVGYSCVIGADRCSPGDCPSAVCRNVP